MRRMMSDCSGQRRARRRLPGRHSAGRWLAGFALALGLAGCQTLYPLPQVDVVLPTAALPAVVAAPPPVPVAAAEPEPPNGAIFRASAYRPLFENHRARLVGDTLAVQITEKVAASARSSSQLDRSGGVTGGVTALPFMNAGTLARTAVTGTGNNTFEGKGTTENSNDFSGSVTVTVVQVLPNGHLIVSGEKQIGINANVDVLRFSGQVDPRSITPGNQVLSTQVANVRIEQRGRGQQADAQAMGWAGRMFLNVLPL